MLQAPDQSTEGSRTSGVRECGHEEGEGKGEFLPWGMSPHSFCPLFNQPWVSPTPGCWSRAVECQPLPRLQSNPSSLTLGWAGAFQVSPISLRVPWPPSGTGWCHFVLSPLCSGDFGGRMGLPRGGGVMLKKTPAPVSTCLCWKSCCCPSCLPLPLSLPLLPAPSQPGWPRLLLSLPKFQPFYSPPSPYLFLLV